MASDQANTIALLERNSQLHSDSLQGLNGRIVKDMGDGHLLVFDSMSDAAKFATTLHAAVENEDFALRTGIHIGEIHVRDNGDVLGDAVNIAARIEAQAPRNAICISESAYLALKSDTQFHFLFIGNKQLKNIAKPVPCYLLSRQAFGKSWGQRVTRKGLGIAAGAALMVALILTVLFSDSIGLQPAVEAVSPELALSVRNSEILIARGDKDSLLKAVKLLQGTIRELPDYLEAKETLALAYFNLIKTYSDVDAHDLREVLKSLLEDIRADGSYSPIADYVGVQLDRKAEDIFKWRELRYWDYAPDLSRFETRLQKINQNSEIPLVPIAAWIARLSDQSAPRSPAIIEENFRYFQQRRIANPNDQAVALYHALWHPRTEVSAALDAALSVFPSNLNMLMQSGWQHYEEGRLLDAARFWLQAYTTFPDTTPPRLNLARIYLDVGNLPTVERLLDPVQKMSANAMEAYILANYTMALNNMEEERHALLSLLANEVQTNNGRDADHRFLFLGRQELLDKELAAKFALEDLHQFDLQYLDSIGDSVLLRHLVFQRYLGEEIDADLEAWTGRYIAIAELTDKPADWHRLAMAYAIGGLIDEALDALHEAETKGWRSYWLSEGHIAFQSLHEHDEYLRFVTAGKDLMQQLYETIQSDLRGSPLFDAQGSLKSDSDASFMSGLTRNAR